MKTNFEIRAVQLDLARQMESMEFLKNFIDFIAEKDYNTLFLYLEWRVRTKTYDIGAKNGYNAEQIRELVEYAGTRGIDIIPGLACIGHAELLLENKKYEHLCELRNDVTGRFWGSPKHEFCPSLPETKKFVESYFTEVAAMFPSQYLHIGADEPFNIGYCELCKKQAETFDGEQALYGDFIQFCHSFITKKLNKRVMMWDDMIELYPDAFAKFPRDIIMVNWQYQKNVTGWKGHFANLEFKDQQAYYEKEGFEYIIGPADYCWSNVETSTANVQNRNCKGGLLTIWEKKHRLMYKYFPIVAATGKLWSGDEESSSEMILHSALADLFHTDDELFLHAIEQYIEFYNKGARIRANVLNTHELEGPNWEQLRALRTMAGILLKSQDQFSGTFAGMIVDDIIADVLMWEAGYRLHLAAYKMINGQETESFDEIAADIAAIWEHNIEVCKKVRTAQDAKYFRECQENTLKMIADFEENMENCGRVDVLFALPDAYEAEKVMIRMKSGSKWITVSDGVDKCMTSAYYNRIFFVPKNVVPSEIEIVAEGFGGIGVAHVSVITEKGKYVPAGISKVCGQVHDPANIVAPDATFAYFGEQSTLAAYRDRAISYAKNLVRVSMTKAK